MRISKRKMNLHNEAVKLLEMDELSFNDVEFIYSNYHEGANKANNLISAHFTPRSICHSMAHNIRQINFVDLCAGIGNLAYSIGRFNELEYKNGGIGICVENCLEYYEVGKKLLPQFHWINGSIFDDKVINEIKEIMKGSRFSIVSNPPYGNQVKATSENLKYQGSKFEYRAMEVGAILGADDGAFLIPQESTPFRMSGKQHHPKGVLSESYKSKDYLKFSECTGIEITPNIGFSTDIMDGNDGWKDVTITTEIAIVEYNGDEGYVYNPKGDKVEPQPQEQQETGQTTLF